MQTAKTQADLRLCWAHSHIVGFVMSRLNYDVGTQFALARQFL